MKKLEITSNHYLQLATPEFAERLYELVDINRNILGKWLSWVPKTKSAEDMKAFLNKNEVRYEKEKSGAYVIIFKGSVAGIVDVQETDKISNKSNLGYWLAKDFHGNGLMTKSVARILEYTYNELGLNRVVIEAAVNNQKSRAIAERLGFQFEGVEREGHRLNKDTYLDMAIYSLLRSEFSVSQKVL